MIKNNIQPNIAWDLDRTDFTAQPCHWELKLELAQHFRVGEWETVKMQLDSQVLDL